VTPVIAGTEFPGIFSLRIRCGDTPALFTAADAGALSSPLHSLQAAHFPALPIAIPDS
jgi:hypothetical protein